MGWSRRRPQGRSTPSPGCRPPHAPASLLWVAELWRRSWRIRGKLRDTRSKRPTGQTWPGQENSKESAAPEKGIWPGQEGGVRWGVQVSGDVGRVPPHWLDTFSVWLMHWAAGTSCMPGLHDHHWTHALGQHVRHACQACMTITLFKLRTFRSVLNVQVANVNSWDLDDLDLDSPRDSRMCSSSPSIMVPFSILSYSFRHSMKSSKLPVSFDFLTSL